MLQNFLRIVSNNNAQRGRDIHNEKAVAYKQHLLYGGERKRGLVEELWREREGEKMGERERMRGGKGPDHGHKNDGQRRPAETTGDPTKTRYLSRDHSQ